MTEEIKQEIEQATQALVNKDDIITIRSGKESDKSYIYATWLRSYFANNRFFSKMEKSVFMRNYHKILSNILENPAVRINVVCLKDDPDTILGYAVFNNSVLHYVFIRGRWRNGLELWRDILPSEIKTITHYTDKSESLFQRAKINPEFNPFIL